MKRSAAFYVFRLLVILVAMLLAAAACGAPATSEGNEASPSTAALPSAGESVSPGAALPPPELTKLTVISSVPEAATIMVQLAQDAGLYQKYGFESVEILVLEGSNLQPLIAGQAQLAISSPNSTLLTIESETPLLDVAVTNNRFLDVILAGQDITTGAQLVGKTIAINSIGDQAHAEVLVALESLGIDPADVNMIQVGGQGDRVAALEAGSVDAIPVEGALAETMAVDGYNILIDLSESDVPYAVGSIETLRSFAEQNPNTVLAFVAANLEAMQLIETDPAQASESLAAWAQVPPEDAAAAIDGFRKVMQRDMRWTQEGYENALETVILQNPDLAGADVTQAYTFQFLDQLEQMGFNDTIGVPSN